MFPQRSAIGEPAESGRGALPAEHGIGERLRATRSLSLELAAPLTAEDMTVQAMDDASPTKWHLAHVTWFFEAFVLARFLPGYRLFDETFGFCFNSYYETLGSRQPRPSRGLLTRPPLERVLAYRCHVDQELDRLVESDELCGGEAGALIELGINHEQQHQELMLTDILSLFAANPLRPAYLAGRPHGPVAAPGAMGWIDQPGGIFEVGHGGTGFAWDNEGPRHATLIHPFRLADRLVTNGEWLEFMADGGYDNPLLWLSDGWTVVAKEHLRAPLYWEEHDGAWQQMSLKGLGPIERASPVCHVSYFEADAFARWAGRRLPTEFEWEVAAAGLPGSGNTLGRREFRPVPVPGAVNGRPRQMFGDVWEWTLSAYLPYPGYRPPAGALGEYNGKFMVGQQVLRGASCVTPDGHSRATYRNFFHPHQRWQFTGLRLASEIA